MADFYQKVATPQTQFRQQRASNGPTVDANARAEAQNKSNNNLGTALQSLLGAAQGVSNIVDKQVEINDQKLADEHKMDIISGINGYNTSIRNYIEGKASESGKALHDLSNEEIQAYTSEGTSAFIESKELSNKPYFSPLQKVLKDREQKGFQKNLELRDELRKQHKLQIFDKGIKSVLSATRTPEGALAGIDDLINTSVGYNPIVKIGEDGKEYSYMPEIQEDKGVIQARALQAFVRAAVEQEDTRALAMLRSDVFKDRFSDIEDYENTVNVATQQSHSIFNKNRQISIDNISDSIFTTMDVGGFKSVEEAYKSIDYQAARFSTDSRPSTQQINRLKQQVSQGMVQEVSYQKYYDKLKSGDYTAVERDSNLKAKDKEYIYDKFFSTETGITDLSPEGWTKALASGQFDAAVKGFMAEGHPLPPSLEKMIKTPASIVDRKVPVSPENPDGLVQQNGIRDKHEAFLHLNRLAEGTPTKIMELYGDKEYASMMKAGRLFADLDSGLIDKAEFKKQYTTYNNQRKNNVDAWGTYVSPTSMKALQDDSNSKWLEDVSQDAPWTTDNYSSSRFIKRQYQHYFAVGLDVTDSDEEARDYAEKMFEARFTPFENPNGSESVIPQEFKEVLLSSKGEFDSENVLKAVKRIKELRPDLIKSGFRGYGRDFMFDRKIALLPSKDYEKNHLMDIFYDGQWRSSISSKQLKALKDLDSAERKQKAEDKNIEAIQSNTN